MAARPFRLLSLFSGGAGLDLGVRTAVPNARTVCYVEINFEACEVLAARMAEGSIDRAPIFTDIAAFDGRPWRGKLDCIVGGFPCQDLSVAGKRAGIGGKRSGLFGEYVRIIEESQPEGAFIENVGGLLSSLTLLHRPEILGHFEAVLAAAGDSPKERWYAQRHVERLHRRLLPIYGISALLYVQCCLGSIGYESKAGLFTASEVGASHKRERIFILAYRKGRCDALDDAECSERRPLSERGSGSGEGIDAGRQETNRAGISEPVLADAECARRATRSGRVLDTGRESATGCGDMGNPNQPGLEGRHECGGGLRNERAVGPAGDPELADANGERRQQDTGSAPCDEAADGRARRLEREPDGDNQPSGFCADRLPIFAPGPGATEQWADVLVRYPWLRPAISQAEAEPAFRGMADGMASLVDGEKTDALRLGGNGVVALQGAAAFVELSRRAGLTSCLGVLPQ